jgi:hypothetical protein
VPFTLAHPAAAVPLARPLGRWGVVSALVIGSLVPDLGYLLFLPLPRTLTHGVLGLLVFCLPVGAGVYLLFHRVLAEPLVALLPASFRDRLHPLLHARPRPAWGAVAVSLVAGAGTHLVWDSFTHRSGFFVQAFPALQELLFSIWRYPVYGFKVLQHGSTAIGFALLARWTARWLRRTPAAPPDPALRLPAVLRRGVVLGVVVVAMAVALAAAAERPPKRVNLGALSSSVGAGVPAGMGTVSVGLLLYCVAWQAARAARRDTAA